MINIGSTLPAASACATALVGVCTLVFAVAFAGDKDPAPGPEAGRSGKVLGIAFDSLQVSDLEKSIDYYRAVGFTLVNNPDPPWVRDEAANRLYRTPGALSRTAALTIPCTASGQPFTLYLRQYKDIERGGRKDFPARAPSAAHLGLIVPEADALWEKLRSDGMLRPLSWDGKLIRMPGQTSGGIAYVMDPDGFNIEIVGVSPKSVGVEDDRTESGRPSLHHIGLVVLNSDKSKTFYGDLLGAAFPETTPEWLSGDMYDAVVGGRGYVIRLINGTFPEIAAPKFTMPFELVEYRKPTMDAIDDYAYSDVAVSCVGFQVSGLDALYIRMKTAGIETWSEGGVVQRENAVRAVVVRDPDVGAFIELFEKPQH
jgi:catechol 2,3-dioxygenase-like lactoylglutathione lyase family enzyme